MPGLKPERPGPRLIFRQLRNRLTFLLQKAKSDFYLSTITENLNNLPPCINSEGATVYYRAFVLECFNKHFIASGSLFSRSSPPNISPVPSHVPSVSDAGLFSGHPFCFRLFSAEEVHRALLSLDTTKSAGSGHLEPYFLKLATDFIAQPLQCIFNLTVTTNRIPAIWKIAYVLPLLKGGDPTCLNNYRPMSKLCILSKVLEN